MEIITEGWPEANQVLVDTISITYRQPNDCTEKDEEGQTLTISTRDGGGGKFLYIQTDGWSIEVSELNQIIKDFKTRLYVKNTAI